MGTVVSLVSKIARYNEGLSVYSFYLVRHNFQWYHKDFEKNQVRNMIEADSSLTATECINRCDALFVIDGHQEKATDKTCNVECSCQIDKNCPQGKHNQTT